MTIQRLKNLFTPFFPHERSAEGSAIAYATSLAEKAKAHLTIRALGIHHESPYSLFPGIVQSIIEPANQKARELVDNAVVLVRNRLKEKECSRTVVGVQRAHQKIIDLVGFEGRLHDLTIIDPPMDYLATSRAAVEEILFHTGRPVIVTPPECKTFKANVIMIAWDGSAKAARALNDAMPFLESADKVEVACVINEKDLTRLVPGAEVIPHLERHNVIASFVDLEAEDGDAAKALRERARRIGADMIVMGAFAHSRWRELVLGGVTESMLRHAQTPILMSH